MVKLVEQKSVSVFLAFVMVFSQFAYFLTLGIAPVNAGSSSPYQFVAKWDGDGSVDGQFYWIQDVAVDSSGNFIAKWGEPWIR